MSFPEANGGSEARAGLGWAAKARRSLALQVGDKARRSLALQVVGILMAVGAVASPDLELAVSPLSAGVADVVRCELTVTAALATRIQLPEQLPAMTNLEVVERIDGPVTVEGGRQRRTLVVLLRLVDAKAGAIPRLPITVVDGEHRESLASPAITIDFESYLAAGETELQPIYEDASTAGAATWVVLGLVVAGGIGVLIWRRRLIRRRDEEAVSTSSELAAAIRAIDPELTPVAYYDRVNRQLLQHLFPEMERVRVATTGEVLRRLGAEVAIERQQLGRQLAVIAERRYVAGDAVADCRAYGETVAGWLDAAGGGG